MDLLECRVYEVYLSSHSSWYLARTKHVTASGSEP